MLLDSKFGFLIFGAALAFLFVGFGGQVIRFVDAISVSNVTGSLLIDNDLNVLGTIYGNYSGDVNAGAGSNVDWVALSNYPSGCGAGEAVRVIGDTLTCISLGSIDGNVNLVGNNSIVFGDPSVSISQDGFNGLELRATQASSVKVISDVFDLTQVVANVSFGSPILWPEDNVYDVGIYSSRPRNIFIGNDLNAGHDVNVTNVLRAPQICLGGDCKVSWPISGDADTNTVTAGWTLNDGNWLVDLNTTKNLFVTGNTGFGVAVPQAKLDIDAAGGLEIALKIKGTEDSDVVEWYDYLGNRLGMFGEYGDITLDRGYYYGDGSQLLNLNAPTNDVFNSGAATGGWFDTNYWRVSQANLAVQFDSNFNRMLAGNVDKNVNAIIALRVPWADANISSSGLWMSKAQFDGNFNRDNNSSAVWLGSVPGYVKDAVFNAFYPVADANISNALTIDTAFNAIFRGDLNAYGGLNANTFRSFDNNAMSLQTQNATRLAITADGNVGVATATSKNKLNVFGDLNVLASSGTGNPYFYVRLSDGNIGVNTIAGAGYRFDLNGNAMIRDDLNANGRVAFGGVNFTFPKTDGANGNAIVTNGVGRLSWGSPAAAPLTGTVVQIASDFNQYRNVLAGAEANLETYSLGNNTYSKIRVRASGAVIGASNTLFDVNVLIIGLDANSAQTNVRVDQTGTGDIHVIPFTVEYAGLKQTASTVNVVVKKISAPAAVYVNSFVVEGIV